MSDVPLGPGWWEASDGKWYAPELHPDRRQQRPPPQHPAQPPSSAPWPGATQFEPPLPSGRVDDPRYGPPSYPSPGAAPSSPVGMPAGPSLYPQVPNKPKRSTGKVLAIIFGGVFLLAAGGCGVFVWAFREEIADSAIDFSDSEIVDPGLASCDIVGVDFGEDYEIEATLTADNDGRAHYQLDFEVLDADGQPLGTELAVLRNMEPGETRTESVFNTIDATDPIESVTCEIFVVSRVDA